MNAKQYQQAKELGRQARRNGKKRTDCPFKGASVRDIAQQWDIGWLEADAERRRKVAL